MGSWFPGSPWFSHPAEAPLRNQGRTHFIMLLNSICSLVYLRVTWKNQPEISKFEQDFRISKSKKEPSVAICMPKKLKPITHVWSHSQGHFGIKAILQSCSKKFYYPRMKKDSEIWVKAWPDCLAKIQRVKVQDATHQPRKTGYVGELLFNHLQLWLTIPK